MVAAAAPGDAVDLLAVLNLPRHAGGDRLNDALRAQWISGSLLVADAFHSKRTAEGKSGGRVRRVNNALSSTDAV
jgi:hypothetical protein